MPKDLSTKDAAQCPSGIAPYELSKQLPVFVSAMVVLRVFSPSR
ncbi:hypothetical protein [Andreprevotia chitinilytica]|nr:hypothetical protein [Andreprevotia chitinilytica]